MINRIVFFIFVVLKILCSNSKMHCFNKNKTKFGNYLNILFYFFKCKTKQRHLLIYYKECLILYCLKLDVYIFLYEN